jgi:hypothetical protein
VRERELGRVRQKSCAWVVGMWFGIRRTKQQREARKGRKGLELMGAQRGMVGALIRAVCTYFHGPVENLTRESYDRLHTIVQGGGESLFMLLGGLSLSHSQMI